MQRWRRLVFVLSVLSGSWVCSSAQAWHSDEERVIDETAYTLPQGVYRVGLYNLDVGLLDNLTAGVHHLPWLLGVVNGNLKWTFYQKTTWALSVRQSVYFADLERLTGTPVSVLSAPMEFYVSYRHRSKPVTFSGGVIFNFVRVDGSLGDESVGSLEADATAAVSNLMLEGNVEFRWSRKLAMIGTLRYIAAQQASASASVVTQVDDFTTVEVVGGADAEGSGDDVLLGSAFQVGAKLLWSWDVFNLGAGVVVGDLILPGFNFPVQSQTLGRKRLILPTLDMYWVF